MHAHAGCLLGASYWILKKQSIRNGQVVGLQCSESFPVVAMGRIPMLLDVTSVIFSESAACWRTASSMLSLGMEEDFIFSCRKHLAHSKALLSYLQHLKVLKVKS
jgi:hypothetical protein